MAKRWVVPALLLAASAAHGLDIQHYEILRENERVEVESREKYLIGDTVLRFRDGGVRVPLSQFVEWSWHDEEGALDGKLWHFGFDQDSLKVRWVKPDEMLWISWSTLSQEELDGR